MIPASFDYVRATSVADAVALLGEHGAGAKLLAGGHSLVPLMKLRLAVPSVLIDIRTLPETSYVRVKGDTVAIGALTRHDELARSPVLRAEAPLVAAAAACVGDRPVRHRGTVGGSLCHADPAADLPAAVVASAATLVIHGPAGRRLVPAADFFLGYFETALGQDELLVEIRVPRTGPTGWHYERFGRPASSWAIVAVATVAERVALANMGPTPLRATATEAALVAGAEPTEAAELADAGTRPVTDPHAGADYRRHLARVLTRRALAAAGDKS